MYSALGPAAFFKSIVPLGKPSPLQQAEGVAGGGRGGCRFFVPLLAQTPEPPSFPPGLRSGLLVLCPGQAFSGGRLH